MVLENLFVLKLVSIYGYFRVYKMTPNEFKNLIDLIPFETYHKCIFPIVTSVWPNLVTSFSVQFPPYKIERVVYPVIHDCNICQKEAEYIVKVTSIDGKTMCNSGEFVCSDACFTLWIFQRI
jgi:hypothetical protein